MNATMMLPTLTCPVCGDTVTWCRRHLDALVAEYAARGAFEAKHADKYRAALLEIDAE